MAFKKGKSGNPDGRSKASRDREEELRAAIDEAIKDPSYFGKKLKEFIDSARDHATKLAALKIMMEYYYGKPRQQVEVEGGDKPLKIVIVTGVPQSEKKPDVGRTAD